MADLKLLETLVPAQNGVTVFDAETQETSYGICVLDDRPYIFDTHRERSSYADDAAGVTQPTWRSCSVLRGGRGSDPRPPASDRLYEGNTRFRRHGQGTAGVAAPPGARERRVPPTNCDPSAAAGSLVRREVDGLRAVVVSLRD